MTARRVFIWQDPNNWRAEVQSICKNIIGAIYADDIRQYAPTHPILEHLHGFDDISKQYGADTANALVSSLRNWFTTRYTSIRVYHGCRSDNLPSYTTQGLVPFDAERYQQAAQHCFLSSLQTTETLQHFNEISAIQARLLFTGKIGFHLDHQFITECATYYVIYGSHSLLATAYMLSRRTGYDFKRILASIGQPTVFVCDIPLSQLTISTLNDVCKTFLVAAIQDLAEEHGSLRIAGLSLTVLERLSPRYITDQFSPKCVKDVLYDNHIG